MLRSSCLFVGLVALSLTACSVYDDSLLQGGAGGEGGTFTPTSSSSSTSSTASSGDGGAGGAGGSGGSGGQVSCTAAAECPAASGACQTAACTDGACGFDDVEAGTLVTDPTAGDCKRAECDGGGAVRLVNDDTDSDDGNECTTDSCDGGVARHDVTVGATCGAGGTCNDAGACVECATGEDCPSGVCSPEFKCLAPACDDLTKNGDESDVDCGGATCAPCAIGKACGADTDCDATGDNACRLHMCASNVCAYLFEFEGTTITDPTPGDCHAAQCDGAGVIVSVVDDTDLASSSTACVIPQCTAGTPGTSFADTDTLCDDPDGAICDGAGRCVECNTTADCAIGQKVCAANVCVPRLVISEIRSTGPGGGDDDFIELYNPTDAAITLDSMWQIRARSESSDYDAIGVRRWIGNGEILPAGGHFLIVGSKYDETATNTVTKNATLKNGITDTASVILEYGSDPMAASTIDAVCYYIGSTATRDKLLQPGYICRGTPVKNPHSASDKKDASIERKPPGATEE